MTQNISELENVFRHEYRKEVENKSLLKQIVLGNEYANI